MTARPLLVALALAGCGALPLRDDSGQRIVRPRNLEHAMRVLDRELDAELVDQLRRGTVSAGDLHFGLGTGLRNRWGLWHRSRLATWFRVRGVFHADDMSSIVLSAYVHHLRGELFDLHARIEEAKDYWRVQAEAHRADVRESVHRAERIRRARSNWVFDDRDVPTVRLPTEEGVRGVVKMERYRRGFLVFAIGWSETPPDPWYADLFAIDDASSDSLRPVERDGCPVIHDAVTTSGNTLWLCKNDTRWLVLDDQSDASEELSFTSSFLRFGTAGADVFLYDERHVYERDGDRWRSVYEHDGDGILPRECDTARKLGERIYFSGLDDGRGQQLRSLDTTRTTAELENFFEAWNVRHFGRLGMDVHDAVPSVDGGLWITTSHRASFSTLVNLTERGYELPIVQGSVDRPVRFREEFADHPKLSAKQLIHQIPSTAVFVDGDTTWLAGLEGIVSARNGHVTPVVRFAFPAKDLAEGLDAVHLDMPVPTRLGRFADGSFLLSDVYRGITLLRRNDGRWTARSLSP